MCLGLKSGLNVDMQIRGCFVELSCAWLRSVRYFNPTSLCVNKGIFFLYPAVTADQLFLFLLFNEIFLCSTAFPDWFFLEKGKKVLFFAQGRVVRLVWDFTGQNWKANNINRLPDHKSYKTFRSPWVSLIGLWTTWPRCTGLVAGQLYIITIAIRQGNEVYVSLVLQVQCLLPRNSDFISFHF